MELRDVVHTLAWYAIKSLQDGLSTTKADYVLVDEVP